MRLGQSRSGGGEGGKQQLGAGLPQGRGRVGTGDMGPPQEGEAAPFLGQGMR